MFINSYGNNVTPEEPICPLVTYDPNKNVWKCVGTGFFIHPKGGIITAKHVFRDIDEKALPTLYAIQSTSGGERHLRPVKDISEHPKADICVAMLGKRRLLGGGDVDPEIATSFTVDLTRVDNGDPIRSFAFPLTKREELTPGKFEFKFQGKWSAGTIVDFHEKAAVVQNPCYQTSMHIEHGASGGPVLRNNLVIGINSSGMDVVDGEDPVSFITPIGLILDLEVPNGNGLISVKKLIEKGYISAKQ